MQKNTHLTIKFQYYRFRRDLEHFSLISNKADVKVKI